VALPGKTLKERNTHDTHRTDNPCAGLGLALSTSTTHGGEIGHYAPGLPNIRDFVMPAPGFYGVLYNYFYTSDRLNDGDGNEINSVTINPRRGPGVTLGVDVDVDIYVLAPALLDDSGSDVRNPDVHDEVHAVGGQLGLTYVPWFASLNMHYFSEFSAQDRFQGEVFGVSVAKKF
jgi:hypothetical protein